jgi:hypothetical protein
MDDFDDELLVALRAAEAEAESSTSGRGGACLRVGETTVLLDGSPTADSDGSIFALSAIVDAHYTRLLQDARGQAIARRGYGIWRELISPTGSMPISSLLEWRSLPGATRAIETTLGDDGQQAITRMLAISSVRSDHYVEWLDVSGLITAA